MMLHRILRSGRGRHWSLHSPRAGVSLLIRNDPQLRLGCNWSTIDAILTTALLPSGHDNLTECRCRRLHEYACGCELNKLGKGLYEFLSLNVTGVPPHPGTGSSIDGGKAGEYDRKNSTVSWCWQTGHLRKGQSIADTRRVGAIRRWAVSAQERTDRPLHTEASGPVC